jgi:hypothetical protein
MAHVEFSILVDESILDQTLEPNERRNLSLFIKRMEALPY